MGVLRRRRGRDVLTRNEEHRRRPSRGPTGLPELDYALLEDEARCPVVGLLLAALGSGAKSCCVCLMAVDRPVYAEVAQAFDMPIGSITLMRMRCLERLRKLVVQSRHTFDGPMDRPREARS